MADNIEDILNDIQRNREKWDAEAEDAAPAPSAGAVQAAKEERREKVAAFRLQMDLNDEYGEYTPAAPAPADAAADVSPAANEAAAEAQSQTTGGPAAEQAEQPNAVSVPNAAADAPDMPDTPDAPDAADGTDTVEPRKKPRRRDRKAHEVWGCAGSLFYVVLTLGVSLVLACVIIMAGLDMTGVNKSDEEIKITLEDGSSTADIASVLKENGIIDQKWAFELYSKVRGVDGKYQPGIYTLSANMGYGNIMSILRAGMPRKTVRVTIPEGYTVDQIATLMENNDVCTKKAFYDAVQNGDYSSYAFVAAIPAAEGDYAGRGYTLEGYLFPDTYDFYTGSDGETVVKKLLDNFDTRLDTTYKAKIAAQNMTINDVVILASIVQGEAADGEWSRVARVLQNRLNNAAEYPYLQCDATINYFKNLDKDVEGLTISQDAYDTHVKRGLPPGAVGNPGLRAIDAVLSPSDDKEVVKCYYFATDYSSGITYYSETYAQHQAICRKYNIGG